MSSVGASTNQLVIKREKRRARWDVKSVNSASAILDAKHIERKADEHTQGRMRCIIFHFFSHPPMLNVKLTNLPLASWQRSFMPVRIAKRQPYSPTTPMPCPPSSNVCYRLNASIGFWKAGGKKLVS